MNASQPTPTSDYLKKVSHAARVLAHHAASLRGKRPSAIPNGRLRTQLTLWRSLDAGRWAFDPDWTRLGQPTPQMLAHSQVPRQLWSQWPQEVVQHFAELVTLVYATIIQPVGRDEPIRDEQALARVLAYADRLIQLTLPAPESLTIQPMETQAVEPENAGVER